MKTLVPSVLVTGSPYVPLVPTSTGSPLIVTVEPGSVLTVNCPRNHSTTAPDSGDVATRGGVVSVGSVVVVAVGVAEASIASGGSVVSVANVDVVVEVAGVEAAEHPPRTTDVHTNARKSPLIALSLVSKLV